MVTSEQLTAYRGLLADGATVREAAIVLTAAAEVDQVIELAFHPDQPRGPDGRWIRSGADLLAVTQHPAMSTMAAAQHEKEIRNIAQQTALRVSAVSQAQHSLVAHSQQTERDRKQDEQIRMLMRQIRLANQHAAVLQKQADISKHKIKSWAMIASLVGGAVLAGVELFLGVPALVQVVTVIAPGVIETLFERHKSL
jgi:hypothetical protein